MHRRRPLLTSAAAALAAGAGMPVLASPGPAVTTIKLGRADAFSQIVLQGAQPLAVRREGVGVIVLRFGRIAPPDLSLLHAAPPPYLKSAEARVNASGVEVRLTLAEHTAATLGRADGGTFVDLAAAPLAPVPEPKTPTTSADQPPAARPDPAPASGVVRMRPDLDGRTLRLAFPWRTPLGAAVFRRGEAVWIVFDAVARLDLSEAPHGLPQMSRATAVQGPGWSAVRLTAPATLPISVASEGGTWTVSLGVAGSTPAAPISLSRDALSGEGAALTAQLAGATGVFWITDPVVGDRFAAVTARGPVKALASSRIFVDAALPVTLQGLAVEPARDDLTVSTDGDLVRIGRPSGLQLSAAGVEAAEAQAEPDVPGAAAGPAVIDFAGWSHTGPHGFLARYDRLMTLAAEEAGAGRDAPVHARLGLARFLAANELSFEAIGVLDALAKADSRMMTDPQFRGLRGAVRAMAGRTKDAAADFSAPVLAQDPSCALWRGYVAARLGDWTGARQAFGQGRSALPMFSGVWKARFARAEAEAALAVGDLGGARDALALARVDHSDGVEADALRLDEARLAHASGQDDQALALFSAAQASPYGAVAAPAVLGAVEVRLAHDRIPLDEAARTLDALRFRWRGDATELQDARALGRIHLAQGRYGEALAALRSAGRSLPDMPEAAGLRADLADTFRKLFLDGQADGLQPIQALALFDDFRELTPIGADGDRMVRRLARRLVDVDLLSQAATLLKYQVDNRLDGVPKAEVATDLAAVLLMDRQPEAALDAINGSRTTLLPAALNAERRTLEARALLGLGRFDHALELVAADKSPEASDLRAEIAWRGQQWAAAGSALEGALGDRWKTAAHLGGDDERRLLRAAVAYSLAQDDAGLTRLRARWGRLAEGAAAPDAMRVALTGVDGGRLTAADFGRATSDDAAFAGWVAQMKARLLRTDAGRG